MSTKLGRPLKFESPEALQLLIDNYFESCFEEKDYTYYRGKGKNKETITEKLRVQVRPFTITGLALSLDTSRKILCEYEDERPAFRNSIKKAKLKVENYTEEQLYTAKNVAGVIFNLKNNYGWVDKKEVDTVHSGRIDHKHSQDPENVKEIEEIKKKYEEELRVKLLNTPVD